MSNLRKLSLHVVRGLFPKGPTNEVLIIFNCSYLRYRIHSFNEINNIIPHGVAKIKKYYWFAYSHGMAKYIISNFVCLHILCQRVKVKRFQKYVRAFFQWRRMFVFYFYYDFLLWQLPYLP